MKKIYNKTFRKNKNYVYVICKCGITHEIRDTRKTVVCSQCGNVVHRGDDDSNNKS